MATQKFSPALKTKDGVTLRYVIKYRAGMKNIIFKVRNGVVLVSANPRIRNIETQINGLLDTHFDRLAAEAERTIPPPPKSFLGSRLNIFGEIYIPKADSEEGAFAEVCEYIAVRGRELLTAYAAKYFDLLNIPKTERPRIVLKSLKSKWGHFHPRRNEIMLNFALCCVPSELCEYVVAHEAAHLKVRSHGAEFYTLGESLLRGFKTLDRQLNRYSTDLMQLIMNNEQ